MNEDRDQIIDRILRRGVAIPQPPHSADVCLDGERLAAWTEGSLPTAEATQIEGHVADCARCQAMVAHFVRSEPPAPPVEAWWRRRPLRWMVPIAATVIVAAVWIAVPEQERQQRFDARLEPPAVEPAPAVPVTPPESQERLVAPPTPRQEADAADKPAAGAVRRERAVNAPPLASQSVAQPAAPPAAVAAAPPAPSAAAPLAETVAVTAQSQAFGRRAPLGDIASSDTRNRWRIVGGSALQRSADGGVTWRAVEFTSSATMNAGHSPAPSILWVVGQGGTIFVTADGTKFERVPFADTSDLVAVVATSVREATVTTSDGRRLRTTDGGATWNAQ